MNQTAPHPIEHCALLHHLCVPQRDEQTTYFDYTAFIMLGGSPEKVEFTSYIPLDEEQIRKAAYDKFYEHA